MINKSTSLERDLLQHESRGLAVFGECVGSLLAWELQLCTLLSETADARNSHPGIGWSLYPVLSSVLQSPGTSFQEAPGSLTMLESQNGFISTD